MNHAIDAARLRLILNDLRLPAIKECWPTIAEQSDKEGWPAARFLASLAEHEIAERDRRRVERHLSEARLLPGKNLDSFDFDVVPMISKAHVMAICAGDSWIKNGANLILIGGPGGGKSHLASAIGLALIENGWRTLFTRTSDLVQKLQVARRELSLEAAIAKLDKYHLLILDDLAYVSKDQAETSVLFELISARYERRSTLITANQPFGEWSRVFPDPAMTLAAVDRLVHHSTIFEMNVDSYRRRAALERKQQGPGRPPNRATISDSILLSSGSYPDCRATHALRVVSKDQPDIQRRHRCRPASALGRRHCFAFPAAPRTADNSCRSPLPHGQRTVLCHLIVQSRAKIVIHHRGIEACKRDKIEQLLLDPQKPCVQITEL
jgi:DNA replication protein DnaC